MLACGTQRTAACPACSAGRVPLPAAAARRHVREEIPFFPGPRVALADLVASLP